MNNTTNFQNPFVIDTKEDCATINNQKMHTQNKKLSNIFKWFRHHKIEQGNPEEIEINFQRHARSKIVKEIYNSNSKTKNSIQSRRSLNLTLHVFNP